MEQPWKYITRRCIACIVCMQKPLQVNDDNVITSGSRRERINYIIIVRIRLVSYTAIYYRLMLDGRALSRFNVCIYLPLKSRRWICCQYVCIACGLSPNTAENLKNYLRSKYVQMRWTQLVLGSIIHREREKSKQPLGLCVQWMLINRRQNRHYLSF